MHTPARVLWVTNNATPYRRPVWAHLSRRVELDVVVLESDRSVARRGTRGADWHTAGTDLPLRTAATVTLARGKEPVHVLLPWARYGVRRADAVLLGGWDSPAYWQVLLLATLLRRRTVGFYESTLASNRFRAGLVAGVRRFFFRRLDAVVVPGPAARDALLAMDVPADRIHTGFNAVDVRRFHEEASRARAAGDAGDGHRYVYVGQLVERKNVETVLRAFARVRRPDDELVVVGTGPLDRRLRQVAGELGVTDDVRWTGHVDNDRLPAVLAGCRTLVLASHEEVWGLVVNEALAAGLDVVVHRDAGVHPSVQDMPGVHGCGADVDSVADAMARSRDGWRGWTTDPPILDRTPEEFAEVFAAALTDRP